MSNDKTYALGTIGRKYDILVFDACAVRGYLRDMGNGRRTAKDDLGFTPELKNQINSGRNYIIPHEIIEELARFKNGIKGPYSAEVGELITVAGQKNKGIEGMF